MKKVKHWLHIILCILTSGLWLPIYVILLATTEMFNRGYREGKAAGRVEKSNEYEEKQQKNQAANFGCTIKPLALNDNASPALINLAIEEYCDRTKSRVDRFAELADRNRTVGLDAEERREYFELRTELSK